MSRRAVIQLICIGLIAVGGCATSFELKNPIPRGRGAADKQVAEARLAAHAAADEYPVQSAPREVAMTAVIDRDAKTLRIINPTDQAHHGLRVWLDQRFVAWVNELPPRRVVAIAQDAFADSADGRPSLTNASVKIVEMQVNGDLYRLLGPAMEPSAQDQPRGRGVHFQFPPARE